VPWRVRTRWLRSVEGVGQVVRLPPIVGRGRDRGMQAQPVGAGEEISESGSHQVEPELELIKHGQQVQQFLAVAINLDLPVGHALF